MRTLLSKKDRAQLTILEVLLEKRKISIDDLAKASHISKQTLASYLDELFITLPFLQIKRKKNELALLNNTFVGYPAVYSHFYHHSDHLAFLEYIFFHPFTQTNQLIAQLQLNPSQYRRIKKQTIDFLEKNHIVLSDSPLHFKGDFYHLARFFTIFLSEKYPVLDQLLPDGELNVVREIVTGFSKRIPEELHVELYLWVMIKLSMHYPRRLTDSFNQEMDYSTILIHQRRFEQTFKIPYSAFIHNIFVHCHAILNPADLITEKRRFKTELLFLREKIYQIFCEKSISSLSASIDLVVHFWHGKNYLLNPFKKRFVLEFFMQNSCFSSAISEQLKKEILSFRIKLNDDDLFFELIYYLMLYDTELIQLFIHHQQAKRIAVACTFGKVHNLMLANYLNQLFGRRFSFEVISLTTTGKIDQQLTDYDFCLTNLTTFTHKKRILCDNFLSTHDLNELVQLFSHSIFQNWIKEFRGPFYLPLS